MIERYRFQGNQKRIDGAVSLPYLMQGFPQGKPSPRKEGRLKKGTCEREPTGKEGTMMRKGVAFAGLGVVLAAIAFLVVWSSLKPKPPEPTRQEASSQPFPEKQKEITGKQPPQDEAAADSKDTTVSGKPDRQGKVGERKAAPFASASWVMEQQRIDPNGLVKESSMSKVWIKGDKKRVETFRTLGSWSGTSLQPMIVALADKEYEYAYYPSQQRMLRIPRNVGMEALCDRMVKKKSEARVGSEVVDGKTCDVYRVINVVNVAGLAKVAMEVKESRWKGLVLKEVSRPAKSSAGDTLITRLKDVQLDVSIPDEKFVLPTGVKIQDVQVPSEEAFRKTLR
jgi:hypothetical protein